MVRHFSPGMIIAIFFGLSILALAIFVVFVIEIEKSQFRSNAKVANYSGPATPDSRILVLYFSRSGNTELMAMKIAEHYSARLVHLEADDYRIGFRGWLNSLRDAQTKHAIITPEKIDLSQYDTIFIGSPIWWYSPAPPIWQFIGNNDFSGKNVILFNTFNSQFKQNYIDEFRDSVEAKKGNFLKHLYVKRGRMSRQISTETMLQIVQKQLESLKMVRK